MATIPAGIIAAWPGTAASIPSGWSRVAALDARHTRAADTGHDGGASGGAASHGHASDPHSHGTGASHTHPGGTSPTYSNPVMVLVNMVPTPPTAVVNAHNHSVPAASAATQTFGAVSDAWAPTTVEPPYYGVIWIVSDGTPTGFPNNALCWWSTSTVPTGFTHHAASEGLYLRGAASLADGGATGGTATHSHTIPAHTHPSGGHTHAGVTVSGAAAGSATPYATTGFPALYSDPSHAHALSIIPSSSSTTSTTSGAPGSDTLDPPFTYQVAIQNTSGSPQKPNGAIGLWLGTRAGIPTGWRLCDGTNSTPDLRGQFVKAVTTLANVGTTGGAAPAHAHTSPATHTHTDSTPHTHAFSESVTVSSIVYDNTSGSTAEPYYDATSHVHGMDSGAASATTGTLTADTQDVLTTGATDIRPVFTDVLFLMAPGDMAVTLTAPLPAAVVTVDNPTVSWTIPGGETQLTYALTLTDLAGNILYATGLVTSALQSATIPAGIIRQSQSYKVFVGASSTTFDFGTSGTNQFSVLFTPSPSIGGVLAIVRPTGLPPFIQVVWQAGSVSAGQVYVQTLIRRRLHGTTPWLTIAAVTPITATSYNDYTAIPGAEYDYAVVTQTTYGLDTLTSLEQSPPAAAELDFRGVWIHLVAAPTVTNLLYHAQSGGSQPAQDSRLIPVWGRSEPTAHVGQQQWQEWTFVGAPSPYVGDFGTPLGPDPWAAFNAFVAAARADGVGGLLMVRFGNLQEGGFGIINWSKTTRTDALGYYTASLVIDEVFYDASGGQ